MKATLIKELNPGQQVYRLDPPYEGHEYVVSSVSNPIFKQSVGRDDTDLFSCDKEGATDFGSPIYGCQDCADCDEPLRRLGYKIIKKK